MQILLQGFEDHMPYCSRALPGLDMLSSFSGGYAVGIPSFIPICIQLLSFSMILNQTSVSFLPLYLVEFP